VRTDGGTDRQTEGWTEGETDMTKLIFAAGNFAKAPKKSIKLSLFVHASVASM
jgi:hypothetical protein